MSVCEQPLGLYLHTVGALWRESHLLTALRSY